MNKELRDGIRLAGRFFTSTKIGKFALIAIPLLVTLFCIRGYVSNAFVVEKAPNEFVETSLIGVENSQNPQQKQRHAKIKSGVDDYIDFFNNFEYIDSESDIGALRFLYSASFVDNRILYKDPRCYRAAQIIQFNIYKSARELDDKLKKYFDRLTDKQISFLTFMIASMPTFLKDIDSDKNSPRSLNIFAIEYYDAYHELIEAVENSSISSLRDWLTFYNAFVRLYDGVLEYADSNNLWHKEPYKTLMKLENEFLQ
jgi:hypothetical protein